MTLEIETIDNANNGGLPITGYMVQIDDGLGGSVSTGAYTGYYTVFDSMKTTNLIINNLVGGRTYRIRYAGRNQVYDSGNMFYYDQIQWSEPLSVLTAVVP